MPVGSAVVLALAASVAAAVSVDLDVAEARCDPSAAWPVQPAAQTATRTKGTMARIKNPLLEMGWTKGGGRRGSGAGVAREMDPIEEPARGREPGLKLLGRRRPRLEHDRLAADVSDDQPRGKGEHDRPAGHESARDGVEVRGFTAVATRIDIDDDRGPAIEGCRRGRTRRDARDETKVVDEARRIQPDGDAPAIVRGARMDECACSSVRDGDAARGWERPAVGGQRIDTRIEGSAVRERRRPWTTDGEPDDRGAVDRCIRRHTVDGSEVELRRQVREVPRGWQLRLASDQQACANAPSEERSDGEETQRTSVRQRTQRTPALRSGSGG